MAKKRKLTPFLAQELMYDYAINALDSERTSAIEEFLKENPESRKTLETIKKGFWYADQLANFEITRELRERLEESENIISLGQKITSYHDYPDWLKWSLISLLASGCVAIVVLTIPWSKIHLPKTDDQTVVLAPLNQEKENHEPAETNEEASNEPESSGDFDESGAPVEDEAQTTPPAQTPKVTMSTPPNFGAIPPLDRPDKVTLTNSTPPLARDSSTAAKSTPVTKLKVATKSKQATTTLAKSDDEEDTDAANESEAAADDQPATTQKSESKPKGFVYRAYMSIPNVEDVADQITQQIKELGGVKAGEVELGWKRGSLRYYHFTLPEENQEKLLEDLRAYGPVRISKDPHPRVMPEGEVRFILSIDAKHE